MVGFKSDTLSYFEHHIKVGNFSCRGRGGDTCLDLNTLTIKFVPSSKSGSKVAYASELEAFFSNEKICRC